MQKKTQYFRILLSIYSKSPFMRKNFPISLPKSKSRRCISDPMPMADMRQLANRRDQKMSKLLMSFAKDESGATAIEYGLIAALIAVAIIAGAGMIGSQLNAKFAMISTTISGA